MPAARSVIHNKSSAWNANKVFFVVLILYSSLALSVAMHWKIPISFELYSQPFIIFGLGVSVIFFAVISARVMLRRPEHLLPALGSQIQADGLPKRVIVGLPVVLVLPVFFSLFTSLKDGISRIVPFYADTALASIDRMIHGGSDAWRFLHPIIGFGPVIFVLNFLYNLWFVVMFIMIFCVVFSIDNEKLRSQYLVAFVLTWALLGNLAATIFASVGPAFVGSFYNNDTMFTPLMNYLQTVNGTYPIWALKTQEILLASSSLDGPRMGSGISAFPSVHVAVATLNAIYLWNFGRFLRWASIAFLVAIQLGSVHLGWHYAVDGYASMLATPVIWTIAGWLSRNLATSGCADAENCEPSDLLSKS